VGRNLNLPKMTLGRGPLMKAPKHRALRAGRRFRRSIRLGPFLRSAGRGAPSKNALPEQTYGLGPPKHAN
jgi:hypothetical protein